MDERPVLEAKFLLGIEHIDRQHRGLFEILGRVHDALLANDFSAGPTISRSVRELLEYTNEHFSSEEATMKAEGYPALDEHRALHHHLLAKVRDIEIRAEFEAQFGPAELAEFLYSWLADHILTEDMAFGEFCRNTKRGKVGDPAVANTTGLET